MGTDSTTTRTRRAILAGGLAAAAAATLGRAQPTTAHDPDDIQTGVINSTTNTTTIWNTAADGSGFEGDATGGGIGVAGLSESGRGVSGTSSTGPAVVGTSNDSYGVWGSTVSSYGVLGDSTQGIGVYGRAFAAGQSGVYGQSDLGRGGTFQGKKAQIRLKASTAATHPASGYKGDLFVDAAGRLWFCKGATTWTQLA
jgi:hypothetical protein